VVVSQDIKQKLLKNNFNPFFIPQKLPMVCEPKEYKYSLDPSKNEHGGYLLNDEKYVTDLIKPRIGYEKPTILDSDNNIVVNMVNGVSKIPFKINTDTLNYIYKYGVEKKILIDDSNKEIQLYLDNPSMKINNELKSIISKLMVEKNVLNIAETYSRFDKIYFPLVLDFRTRLYCETVYFDYQKDDLAKGLISFARPGIITKNDDLSFSYFKAYGANMFGHGLDKKSLKYRVKWVDDNSEKILNFEYNDIVENAKNKPCFVSFCFEYLNYINFMKSKESTLFYTYLPIRLDATCNGYQHLVLLTKEVKLLNKLNLDKSTHEDDPNDFYTYIQDNTNEFITNEIKRLSYKLENENVNLENLKDIFNKTSKQLNKTELEKLYSLFKSNHITTNNIDTLNLPKKTRDKGKKDLVKNEIYLLYKKINKNMQQNEKTSNLIKEIKNLEKDIKDLESYKKLKNINLDRPIIKKIIMRESYSASIPRLVGEIKAEMREIVDNKKFYYLYSNSDIKLTQYDLALYVMSLKNVATKLAPNINNLSKYLDGIVKIFTELNKPIP
jgi:DNA-dependent RNA polymerase